MIDLLKVLSDLVKVLSAQNNTIFHNG